MSKCKDCDVELQHPTEVVIGICERCYVYALFERPWPLADGIHRPTIEEEQDILDLDSIRESRELGYVTKFRYVQPEERDDGG